jgi:hypothetical protein
MRTLIIAAALLIPTVASAQNAAWWVEFAPGVGVGVVVQPDGKIIVFNSLTVLKTTPPADPNPYPAPSQNLRTVVEPLRTFNLSPQDGRAMASLYAQAAGQVPGTLKDTAALRQWLIEQGQPLNIRGKYSGYSAAADGAFKAMMGDDVRPTTADDAAALRAAAWAVWRSQ